MKHLPIIFPISLAVIVLSTFFAGAWATSENTVQDQPIVYTVSVSGVGSGADSSPSAESPEIEWYERAAIWVCPLH